jgi:voltage-gated sodium channel
MFNSLKHFKNKSKSIIRWSWVIYESVTSQIWFELFIMSNIILVGITTGIDLENRGRDEWTLTFSRVVNIATLIIFTLEILLKIVAEGYEPWLYFTDLEYGYYNAFDFIIVSLSYLFLVLTSSAGGAISGLRMLRLIRLLTFIKHVPHLRVLVNGLVNVNMFPIYMFMHTVVIECTWALLCVCN